MAIRFEGWFCKIAHQHTNMWQVNQTRNHADQAMSTDGSTCRVPYLFGISTAGAICLVYVFWSACHTLPHVLLCPLSLFPRNRSSQTLHWAGLRWAGIMGLHPAVQYTSKVSPYQRYHHTFLRSLCVETYYCLWQAVGNDLVFEVEVIDPKDNQRDMAEED